MYDIQHCFICRPSDSAVSEDAGIEPRTVATTAMTVRRSNHSARSNPYSAISHPQLGTISSIEMTHTRIITYSGIMDGIVVSGNTSLLVLSSLLSSARRFSRPTHYQRAYALSASLRTISKPTHYQQAYPLSESLPTIGKPTHYQQAYPLSASLPTISKPTHYQ
jgi:hypothetical protein